jgi:hypothetical protein
MATLTFCNGGQVYEIVAARALRDDVFLGDQERFECTFNGMAIELNAWMNVRV